MLRRLAEADYPAVAGLWDALEDLHVQARPKFFQAVPFPKENYDALIADPECLLLGAFCADRLVGFLRATLYVGDGADKTARTVSFDNIYVLEEHRRGGVASALCEELERWSKEQGAKRIDLTVWGFNENALAFYRTLGMKPQRYVLEKEL